ncbi:MAG: Ppx/GppA family phosphatase [Roseovarius sp.]|nr:Ppx/GppA family phosphatase [Roseovarius sp.]MCY4209303.1 Ppx/GppA family phosphatase [Roseovarius sp.]
MNNGDDKAEGWIQGHFGRPLFNNPMARALSRVGVIDIGSNSVRMVVFDGAARSPAYFYNEKIMCALGEGLAATGRLNPGGRIRALNAMVRFKHLCETMNVDPLTAVATAAVRKAVDGDEFCRVIEAETGIGIHVLDGNEEARFSAQGVLLGWPGSYGLVCDIGGYSMELAEINGDKVGRRLSTSLGPFAMQDIKGGRSARKRHIREILSGISDFLGEQNNRLFLVGGSWRAMAKIDMCRRGYPLNVLHEYRMSPKSVRETIKYMEVSGIEHLRANTDISLSRISLLPHAAEVLREVVKTFKPRDIAISSYGIREGLLFEHMPETLRDRDPLIEACQFAEHKDARLPGYGQIVFEFIEPLFKSVRPDRMRIIKAACLLHDVSWRAHPDYRAEVCFDYATRANLGGLTHRERVFLGLALLHRYSNKRNGAQFENLNQLADDADLLQAEVLGKAMRFAAMFWQRKDSRIGILNLRPRKRILVLKLKSAAIPLFGEVAKTRFQSLANSLQAEPVIKFDERRSF